MGHLAPQRARFLAPGDKLGKYDLIRQIAVGGMAELYLARTVGIEGFEKLVVVKRILPQFVESPSFVNMFLNEARLAATLHHPNIAQVYDIGQENGEYFFSMEYVHGEDLGSLLASATENGVPISLDAALTLVAGLCAGLHHAHEKLSPDGKPLNVVHRDVSPSNVLVSYDGGVKLVDFGIARMNTTPASVTGGLKGKISYMSPEQCRSTTALDRRSDIFSVGTLLYELTTGQLPFTGESDYGILDKIVNTDVEPPSKIVPSYPPALQAIVLRALARDPRQRYGTALELQGQLEDFAHDNRLRVSPLVLARLMTTLFAARLEEWEHAKAQGAFFVEQHVVRTLIENGRSDDDALLTAALVTAANAAAAERTELTQPPVIDEDPPTGIRTPVPALAPVEPRARARTLAPGAHEPQAYRITPMPGALPPPGPGTLVSGSSPRLRVSPVQLTDATSLVQAPRRQTPILLAALAGAAVAIGVTVLVLRSDGAIKEPAPISHPAPVPHAVKTVPPPPPVDEAPVIADDVPPAQVVPTLPAGSAAPPAVTPPRPTTSKSRPKLKPRPDARPTKPADKPGRKPDPKEPEWNADSPFMPVR